jgi:hypothetical protein
LSFVIGSVTLPSGPSVAKKRLPAAIEEFEVDGDLPILIVAGSGAIELTLEGSFVGTKSTIETSYLSPLEALKGTEVALTFPDSRYDGNWILADFVYVEINAKQFRYTIRLLQGSDHIVL